MHNSLAPGLGKIGVLVALEFEAPSEALAALGRQLAMHVAAANPLYLDIASVPAAALDRERDVLREQARRQRQARGRSSTRMVEGRLRKFYEEAVLLDQIFVDRRRDPGVEGRRGGRAKSAGAPIRVAGFVRLRSARASSKPPTDFAAEVAAHAEELSAASHPGVRRGRSPTVRAGVRPRRSPRSRS